MTYVIAQPCVDLKDRACVDECPVDCIYEGKRMLYIHPDECVDCGACEPVCPVEAIFYEDDTPEQWKDYYDANVDFFDDLGSPGGAAKMGEIDKDHPLVAALPPAGARRVSPPVRRPVSAPAPGLPLGPAHARTPQRARAHPDGIVDLSVGTPVDPTPAVVQDALRAAADSPGYPLTIGRAETRQAAHRLAGAPRTASPASASTRVLPTIGSKELIALAADPPRRRRRRPGRLPGAGLPDVRGRRRARRRPRAGHRLADRARARGAAAAVAQLARPTRPAGCCRSSTCARSSTGAASAARCWSPTSATSSARWEATPGLGAAPATSAAARTTGILAVHSLSKRSNLAGYRCAFVAGDPALVGELLAVRKNLGLMMPGPQQARDGRRARRRRARRRAARDGTPPGGPRCATALEAPGFRIDHSEASLYLWATRGEDCWDTVAWLAERGHPGRARAPSTAPPGASTCGSRSPRPTSASPRPSPASLSLTRPARTQEQQRSAFRPSGASSPPIRLMQAPRHAQRPPVDRRQPITVTV